MSGFERRADGIHVSLEPAERAALTELAGQLSALLETVDARTPGDDPLAGLGIGGSTEISNDPALARLLPDAYRDDPAASTDHRRLTEAGLVARKRGSARAVIDSLAADPVVLDPGAALAWATCLTDLRLALAARLGIEHDGDEGTGDEGALALYDWLGWLQGGLVEELD